jgi:hypothetical protein
MVAYQQRKMGEMEGFHILDMIYFVWSLIFSVSRSWLMNCRNV